MLTNRFGIDYGILHSCTLDSMGHSVGHDCIEMDQACYTLDGQLAPYIREWRRQGYEVMVTADHGQSERGHHGGRGEDQQDAALYYFGDGRGPEDSAVLKLTQLAPTILTRLGAPVPETMRGSNFLA